MFNDARMHVQRGYPRPIGPRWFGCPRHQASSHDDDDDDVSRSSVSPRHPAAVTALLITVIVATTSFHTALITGAYLEGGRTGARPPKLSKH